MSRKSKPLRQSRVPAGRLERFARFGMLSGELALGTIVEGLRQLGGAAASGSLMINEANALKLARRHTSGRYATHSSSP